MNVVTTTDLRTQTTQLVSLLQQKAKVFLVHRSKVIGIISPSKEEQTPVFNSSLFLKQVKKLNLSPTSIEQRRKRYQQHMTEKYGQSFS